MKIRSKLVLAALVLGAFALALPAFADHHEKPAQASPSSTTEPGKPVKMEPSAEDRAKMADAHQKMAECLRSTRPFGECRGEMMKQAHSSMGHGKACKHGESCPHGQDCPHGDACDGSCKHHGHHGMKSGEMCGKSADTPKADATTPKADPKSKKN